VNQFTVPVAISVSLRINALRDAERAASQQQGNPRHRFGSNGRLTGKEDSSGLAAWDRPGCAQRIAFPDSYEPRSD
jgi:hypothetical protein